MHTIVSSFKGLGVWWGQTAFLLNYVNKVLWVLRRNPGVGARRGWLWQTRHRVAESSEFPNECAPATGQGVARPRLTASVCSAVITKYRSPGGLDNRTLFSPGSRDRKFKIRVLAGLVSSEASACVADGRLLAAWPFLRRQREKARCCPFR